MDISQSRIVIISFSGRHPPPEVGFDTDNRLAACSAHIKRKYWVSEENIRWPGYGIKNVWLIFKSKMLIY